MLRRCAHSPTQVLTVLACLAVGGCAAFEPSDTGIRDQHAESRAQAQAQAERVATLEARLGELERRTPAPIRDRASQARVERLIEQNEALLAVAVANCDNTSKVTEKIPTASFDTPADVADDRQRQQLAQRLRAYLAGRSGGLSVEQREAMRVLLRPDRVLDRSDPWRR